MSVILDLGKAKDGHSVIGIVRIMLVIESRLNFIPSDGLHLVHLQPGMYE